MPSKLIDILTPREREIVRLVSLGMSDTGIAETLFVSIHTLRNHMARARRKLGVDNRGYVHPRVALARLWVAQAGAECPGCQWVTVAHTCAESGVTAAKAG